MQPYHYLEINHVGGENRDGHNFYRSMVDHRIVQSFVRINIPIFLEKLKGKLNNLKLKTLMFYIFIVNLFSLRFCVEFISVKKRIPQKLKIVILLFCNWKGMKFNLCYILVR